MFKLLRNPLFWIFVLALVLRIYKLGEFPYGFHVDEVKVAWNSLSILKTGQDDNGNLFSLYYNSFGDYRPTGLFYLTIPSIIIFGRSIFATRFPVALFGALMVLPIYFLVEILDKNKKTLIKNIGTGHLAAFLIAISPWGIDLSRATNEVVVSTFFALYGLFFFIRLIKFKTKKYGFLSIISIVLSYFFYHAIRFLAPPILIITFLYYLKEIKTAEIKRWIYICIASTIFLSIFFSTTDQGLARFNQVSIFKGVDITYQIQRIKNEAPKKTLLTLVFDNKYVTYFKTFMDQYSSYFAGDFLIGPEGKPYRFATPGVGLITYIEAVLLIFGGVAIIKRNKNLLPLLLLLTAPLPAAITTEDVPNLSRAFLMLPFLIIIESYGFEALLILSKKYKQQIFITIFSLLILNFAYFSYMYFAHSINHKPFIKNYFVDSPTYRNIGATELALQLDSLSQKYDKIIITNFPDNPYPWYAFFTNKEPANFNKTYNSKTMERDYKNIIFSQEKCPTDSLIKYNQKNTLLIDSWECPYQSQINDGVPLKIINKITRPDTTEVYILLERDWSKPLLINGVYY